VNDLDIDSAFELAQIQRQLSQWHVYWPQAWSHAESRQEMLILCQSWVDRLHEMAGVFA
jgi:hypothetical protein